MAAEAPERAPPVAVRSMEVLGACALGKEDFGGMRANVPPAAVQT
jgi:hypothetical protein